LRAFLLIIVFVAFASLAPTAQAKVTLLAPGTDVIQAALDGSASADTVLLAPGHYFDSVSLVFRNGVTVRSIAGPEQTIVDLQYNFGSVIYVNGAQPAPTIEGLTLERGAAVSSTGGGILCTGSSPNILGNLILGCEATNLEGVGGAGGGIAVFGGAPLIRNNTIVGNLAGAGGIYLEQSAATVDHNVIAYDAALDTASAEGYGLVCAGSSGTSVHDNMFWANHPDQTYGSCAGLDTGNNITLDPEFCRPAYAVQAGQADWRVRADSPLAPGHAYFGWGAAVSTCSTTDARSTSWGRLKATYR